MSRQASPAVIGGFVVGALVLVVAGIVVFGSGRFFANTSRAVMYFEGDIKGLQTGAAVAFQGVPIGTVSEIRAVFDPQNAKVQIPVIVEIRPDRIEFVGPRPQGGEGIQKLVQRGMRAQLQIESMVTSQFFIQLDFHLDAPAAELKLDPLTKLPQIPTIPTTIQQVQQMVRKALEKIGDLPLEDIVNSIHTTLQGVDRLMNAPEVMEAVRNVNTTMTDVQQLVRNLDKQLTPLTASATEAMGSVGKLARNADEHVATLTDSLKETVGAVRVTLESAQEVLKNVNGVTAPNSPVGYELVQTLRQLSEAARALRVLADFLERNPNALLFGRNEVKAQ
ncbi:MAG: MCE family protein [Deltaproteobacteria bacterium]|nr:MCE family protein [Deltaproteobacteria bacterium]